jgi:hypothetical protein
VGYATLMELAFRAADSIEVLGPDNTGDLAARHMGACVSAAQEVVRILPYVVVDELDGEGAECRCPCPTCGLGVCGCPLAFRRRLDLARGEAGPLETWPGLVLVRPRSGSPARQAGLEKGDVLRRVDGRPIESLPMLQEVIKAHTPDDPIHFEVERGSREPMDIAVARG